MCIRDRYGIMITKIIHQSMYLEIQRLQIPMCKFQKKKTQDEIITQFLQWLACISIGFFISVNNYVNEFIQARKKQQQTICYQSFNKSKVL